MKLGLLGRNISYSLSPKIHNFMLKELGEKDFTYDLIDVDEDKINEGLNCDGLNVTIPYKEKIIKYIDLQDDLSMEVGAVNTVAKKNGKYIGYNTDVYGAMEMMKDGDVKGKEVTIIGSGGASRAIVVAANNCGAKKITVVARNNESLGRLKKDFPFIRIRQGMSIPKGDIIVNATPLGNKAYGEKLFIKNEKNTRDFSHEMNFQTIVSI